MQTSENDSQIQQLIKNELNLPSPPAIAVKILDTIQKDDVALTELGQIISADPALTAKTLQVANSDMFACNSEIKNINRAMSVLGTNLIKNIALSFIIAAELNQNVNDAAGGFDLDLYWRHSITAAVSAELIAKAAQHQDDDIFVTALLQNIGILVISMTKGKEYDNLLKEARTTTTPLIELENEKYGFDHQQVGYTLLLSWYLPDSISEPILYHHNTEKAPESCQKMADILYLSEQLANVYNEPGTGERARLAQQNLVEQLDIDDLQALELLDTAAINSSEMITTFELDPGDIRPYSVLLQEANAELGKLNLSNEQMILEMREAKEKADRLANELQDANSSLKALVYRDGLTGLYNHRYFQEALTAEIGRAARYKSSVSLILFDIDFFKKVNDRYGHPAGDLVLMNISSAVNSVVRPCDIVTRYGGEEFAVILPETSAAGVKVFATRLRRCIEGIETSVDGQLIYVTVSSGATTFSGDQPHITKNILIETADRGLYLSKQNGRNQVTVLEPPPPPLDGFSH